MFALINWARQCLSVAQGSISVKGRVSLVHIHPSQLSTVSCRLFHAMGTDKIFILEIKWGFVNHKLTSCIFFSSMETWIRKREI